MSKIDLESLQNMAETCERALSEDAKKYLNDRGIEDRTIKKFGLGFGKFYGASWITIPVFNAERELQYLKLRHFPENAPCEFDRPVSKYSNFPQGCETVLFNEAELFGKRECVIVEGELDAIVAGRHLEMSVVALPGADVFKAEWLERLTDMETVWLWLDNDDAGHQGRDEAVKKLATDCPNTTIMGLSCPEGFKDATEFFCAGGTVKELFASAEHLAGPPMLSEDDLRELSLNELSGILSTTIKYDDDVKVILFLALLLMYTEQDQINVCLLGQSSSGKTYLAQQVAKYFPEEDVKEYAEVSPTAFKHMSPKVDEKTGKEYVDCERKGLLFTEMPHPGLLSNLRPLLSHDKKEIEFMTTDRGKTGSNVAKHTIIRGFPSVIFCSAHTKLDEQEITRCLLLSPEVSDAKVEAAVELAGERTSNPEEYAHKLEADRARQSLMRRIRFIKGVNINSVIIEDYKTVLKRFREVNPRLAPRSQRDIVHFCSIIKAVAMLNAHTRMDESKNVIATENDIALGEKLWRAICGTQMLGLPPVVHDFFIKYIVPTYENIKSVIEKDPLSRDDGVSYEEILKTYYERTGSIFNRDTLVKQIMPPLVTAGLVSMFRSKYDGRCVCVKPLL